MSMSSSGQVMNVSIDGDDDKHVRRVLKCGLKPARGAFFGARGDRLGGISKTL
jgi:hypothetical protein